MDILKKISKDRLIIMVTHNPDIAEKYSSRIIKILDGEEVEDEGIKEYSYAELLNTSFKLLLNTDYYEKDEDIWLDKSEDEDYIKEKVEQAEEIKVVGIIRPSEGTVATSMSGTIGYTTELKMAELMQQYTENAKATYEGNLEKMGVIDLSKPSSISIYPKDFESKDQIATSIENYNQKQRDEGNEANVITYTDLVGTMMSSVSTIIDAISYVLIAFVAISLVVSSIMIGIITYISVLERTKKIEILRSIGASKKDISRVFNAETFIVGLGAGILGIGVTLLLNIPINIIIKAVTDIGGLASLPVVGGIILVVISMLLTVIAGLIPAKMASKKDPVEALRTE